MKWRKVACLLIYAYFWEFRYGNNNDLSQAVPLIQTHTSSNASDLRTSNQIIENSQEHDVEETVQTIKEKVGMNEPNQTESDEF